MPRSSHHTNRPFSIFIYLLFFDKIMIFVRFSIGFSTVFVAHQHLYDNLESCLDTPRKRNEKHEIMPWHDLSRQNIRGRPCCHWILKAAYTSLQMRSGVAESTWTGLPPNKVSRPWDLHHLEGGSLALTPASLPL